MNQYQPHLVILPEDDANYQISLGFVNNLNVNNRMIQVVRSAGGWGKVIKLFEKTYISLMRKYLEMRIILLIDFDQSKDRLDYIKQKIPKDLINRVFILGVQSNPEALKRSTRKSLETIGDNLAEDCPNSRNKLWEHELLKHNQEELDRINLDSSLISELFIE